MNLDQLNEIKLDQLQPGQRHDLQLKFKSASGLLSEVKQQIAVLERHKKAALELQNLKQAAEIEGLKQNMDQLRADLDKQIAELTAKLKIVPAPVKKLFAKLEKECSEYISAVKKANDWLYRGSSGSDEYVAKSWLTRRPKDSSRPAQELFDQMLASLGFVALRGNSIFATSDFDHAEQFGEQIYVIFPVDHRSHFTYTNEADVTLNDVSEVGVNPKKLAAVKKELHDILLTIKKTGKFKTVPLWLTRLLDYTKPTDFWSWQATATELTKMPAKYASQIPEKFKKLDVSQLVDLEGFVHKYKPQNKNLDRALIEQVEVYISGVYYALSVAKYHEYISNYFGVEVREY